MQIDLYYKHADCVECEWAGELVLIAAHPIVPGVVEIPKLFCMTTLMELLPTHVNGRVL